MDPFLQLSFSFPVRMTPVASGTSTVAAMPPAILASQLYDPHHLGERYEQCYGDASVDTKLQVAILMPVWNVTRAPDLPCSFDSCTWPTITTLGVCSSCTDLTATVTASCVAPNAESLQCNYTIPASATNTTGNGTTFVTVFSVTGGATERLPYQPLWNSTVDVYTSGGLLYFDTRGSTMAELVRTSLVSFAPDLPWSRYIGVQDDDTFLQRASRPSNRPWSAPYAGPQTPLNMPSVPLPTSGVGLVELMPLLSLSSSSAQNMTFHINFCDYTDLATYMADLFTTAQFDDIAALMGSIADSMTESIRTTVNSTAHSGMGYNSITYIEIAWALLALPIALVVLTFALLVVVILRNRALGTPVGKSASIALLFHSLEGWDQSELHVDGPAEMTARLEQMTVQMVNVSGWHAFTREE
ncbi:hypothetical protein SCUCBS95973_007434 [Sporothrix curviconia]|uniref:Transmembrane protein n=1 Tax=Sporothrix curviconia TaxID=1260050 RepID=A0ABP0CF40_9PEZI